MPGFFFLSWSVTACQARIRLWDAKRKLTIRREREQAGRGTKGEAGNRGIPFVRGRACRAGIRLWDAKRKLTLRRWRERVRQGAAEKRRCF